MTAPDVQRAAEFLASNALGILALGMFVALLTVAAVIGTIHLLRSHWKAVWKGFTSTLRYAQRYRIVERSFSRSKAFLPGPYLALHLLLGFLVVAAATVFVAIAENVIGGGDIAAFDRAFAQALWDSSSPASRTFFAAVSWLGQGEVLAVIALVVAVYLLIRRDWLVAAGWIGAQAGGGLLNALLKETFERTRPSFADPLLAASSWSFPSGHAMGTFVLFGMACCVFLRNVRSWTTAAVIAMVSLSWCALMAFSRLYLGVHYVSDVVAGVVAGAGWVAACASALEVIQQRRITSGNMTTPT
jgi:undecaprenyl-diphosphatase